MRVLFRCLVPLTGLALAVTILLNSPHITPHFQTLAIQRFFARPFAYPGPAAAQIPRDPNFLFDPVLVYSTFLGGPGSFGPGGTLQGAAVLFVDALGNTYVAGTTSSPSFPVTPGAVGSSNTQGQLGFLSKIDPTGQSLLFSTYIPGIFLLTGLAVDPHGNIFVAGRASSLPIPPGTSPFQSTPKSISSIGILKLNSTATALLNATFLDGSGSDSVGSIAVDSAGNLYVYGSTSSNDFPTTPNALQTTLGVSANPAFNTQNGFVTKLNPSLSALVYSTYLGRNSSAGAASGPHGVAVDSSGNAYVTGSANAGFPPFGAVQPSCPPSNICAFLAKLNPTGSALAYSTYLAPPAGTSQGVAVAVDGSQNAYVGGETSLGFPEVNSVESCSSNGGFLSEIDASGTLKFSTCLGTGGIWDLALDSSGNVAVVGSSDTSLPLKNPIQTNPAPIVNPPFAGPPFVGSISPNTNPPALLFSSFIGGAQPDEVDIVGSVGADSSGSIYIAGTAAAGKGFTQAPAPFPVFNALQPIPAVGQFCIRCASSDAFLMKVSSTDAPAAALTPALLSFPPQQVGSPSAAEAVTVIDLGSASLTVSNVTGSGDFSFQNNCSTVSPAGGTCTIQVTFMPTAAGTRNGTLTITDNSAGSPRAVELTGQGAVTTATVAPSSLTFANQLVGTTSSAQTITVTNPGPLGLQISHIQASGDFSETNNCGTSLNPGVSCTLNVTFTPSTSGNRTGTLTVTDDATGSPQTVSLTGTGSAFSLASTSSSATVNAGQTASFSLTVLAGTGFSGAVNFTCSGAPPSSTCNISPNSVNLTSGSSGQVSVTVQTAAHAVANLNLKKFFIVSARAAKSWTSVISLFAIGFLLFTIGPIAAAIQRRMLVSLAAVLLCLTVAGCGSATSSSSNGQTASASGTPAGQYALVITASSGAASQTITLNLMVH